MLACFEQLTIALRHCDIQIMSIEVTCAKVGARPSGTGEKVWLGPSRLNQLPGRGSSSVNV